MSDMNTDHDEHQIRNVSRHCCGENTCGADDCVLCGGIVQHIEHDCIKSKTPETDAAESDFIDIVDVDNAVPSQFSRKLELQRNAWRKCAEELAEYTEKSNDPYDIPTLHILQTFNTLKGQQ